MICPNCGYSDDKKPRSTQQNRAWFGLCVQKIADHLGYDKEDMYKILALKFLGAVEIKIEGETIRVPKSTRKLTTKEFCEFVEKIQRWAAEYLGMNIPDPNSPPLENP